MVFSLWAQPNWFDLRAETIPTRDSEESCALSWIGEHREPSSRQGQNPSAISYRTFRIQHARWALDYLPNLSVTLHDKRYSFLHDNCDGRPVY